MMNHFKAPLGVVLVATGIFLLSSMASDAETPLLSPWDATPVTASEAGYDCPAFPQIGPDLTTDGFYRKDDPTHSIIDPARQAAYERSSGPVKKVGTEIVKAADAYRTTGSRRAADCVEKEILALVNDRALTGHMSSDQAYYVQGWVVGAIAIAHLKVRETGAIRGKDTEAMASWMRAVGQQTIAYYARHDKTGSGDSANNHLYWAGVEVAAIGIAANDSDDFKWGLNTYKIGVSAIRPDGTLPREMGRGARALHYHLYSIAPLVFLAELGAANHLDLYSQDGGAIHRLVQVSLAAIQNPAMFEKAAGAPQENPKVLSGDQIGWAPPYEKRFPNPFLEQLIQAAPTLSVFYLGGLPPTGSAPAGKTASQGQPAAGVPAKGDVTEKAAAGDSPDDPGPLASDLSSALKQSDVRAAMKKVADWQVTTGKDRFNRQWTFAPLYDGLLAASATTGDPLYRNSVRQAAEQFHWSLIETRFPHADDQAIGLAYLTLYRSDPSPEKIAALKAVMDRLVVRPDDPQKNLWWWCDALFMAPPVMARLSEVTKDPKYLAYMDKEWDLTRKELYDPQNQLYSRDATFLKSTEPNGKKLFWSRGNGWVLAGLAEVIQTLPAGSPLRQKYVTEFQTLAARVLLLQSPDGTWHSGLLDPDSHAPEVSGTGFFAYAMAWGVNAGLLPRAEYQPAIAKAWSAMVGRIYQSGRLGSIQPIGAAPDAVKASSSYVYGVGAFLLAGSEIDTMVSSRSASGR